MIIDDHPKIDGQKKTDREWCLAAVAAHELYQCGLASYAFGRHGTITQLKGVVHECAYVLRHNVNPLALWEKGIAYLNPNLRDMRFDVLFSAGPGVQLKDAVSASGARATALRVPTYPGAVLGTPETVRAVAKHGVEISSSGVSTAHNEAIAARAGGMGGVSWSALGRNVRTGAAVGAVLGLGIAAYEAYERHQSGEGSWQQLFDEALRNALVGVAVGGAGALAGTVASAVLPAGNVAIVGGLIVGIGAALVISKITDEQWVAFFGAATAFLATVNSKSPEADASAS